MTNKEGAISHINIHKCAVIGCGNVGATTAYTLMQESLFTEMVLIDIDRKRAEGEASDMTDGLPFLSPANIYAGDYSDLADCYLIIVAAGAPQRPGETRIDLVRRNSKIFEDIIGRIKCVTTDAILLVVTNPVDILTHVSAVISGYPSQRVIGSGTVLDTARLKQLLGNYLGVDSRNVHSFIIGEHGDSELAVWSSANISGIDLHKYFELCGRGYDKAMLNSLFEEVRTSAYRIIEAKGSTYYAIAMSVRRIVEALVRDEDAILPVSTISDNAYGIDGICMSLPCIIGRNGIKKVLEIPLDKAEEENLRKSAKKLGHVIVGLRADGVKV